MEDAPELGGPLPTQVTQRVPLEEVEDLLARPARAAIAFAGPDGPECLPVVVHADGAMRIGVDPSHFPARGLPEQVVLVVDDGAYWFELRAAVWRGTLGPEADDNAHRTDAGDDLTWFDFEPRRFAAWDYGQLREETPQ